MAEKITLKEIAKACNVSVATVSRVINQTGRFSKETDEKVRQVIAQYHYQPNQAAKGLRTTCIDAIGVIVPDITNEFFSAMILGLQKYLFENNYSCIIFNTNESSEIEKRCFDNLLALNVSGIISANSTVDYSQLLQGQLPTVYIDRAPEHVENRSSAAFLFSDHEDGAYQAGRELAHCGCKEVACITALADASATELRTRGFERACRDYGLHLTREHIFTPREASMDNGYAIVEQALRQGMHCDGLFCQTDWLAIGALMALLKNGVRVPEDMQLIGFDDIRAAKIAQVPVTTIRQPSVLLGQRAAAKMLQMLDGYRPNGEVEKLPVQLIRRATTCLAYS